MIRMIYSISDKLLIPLSRDNDRGKREFLSGDSTNMRILQEAASPFLSDVKIVNFSGDLPD